MEGSSVSTDAEITHDQQPETLPTAEELVCNICLVPPTNPVVTACGHLYCWPCLYRWMQVQTKPCPVCKSMLRANINLTPIYASDGSSSFVGSESSGARAGPTDAPDTGAIPPRPNPRTLSARVQAVMVEIVSARTEGFLTLNVVKAAFDLLERVHERLRRELVQHLIAMQLQRDEMGEERVEMQGERGSLQGELDEMRRERTQLQQNVNDVIGRNVALAREIEERDRRHLGFVRVADERERRHFVERSRMEERIATLESVVARATRPLQRTVDNLVERNMVLTRQVEGRHSEERIRMEQRIATLQSAVTRANRPRRSRFGF